MYEEAHKGVVEHDELVADMLLEVGDFLLLIRHRRITLGRATSCS